jgi:hypothetical protein
LHIVNSEESYVALCALCSYVVNQAMNFTLALSLNKITRMRKAIFLAFCVCLASLSFSQAYEDKVQYDKKKQQAIAIEYGFPPKAVENAIVRKFAKLGYKPKEEKGIFNPDKGFIEFRNAYVTDISRDRMDYIFSIERKSRKERDETVVHMIMYRNEANALDKMEAPSVGHAKEFLNLMLPGIEAEYLELQILDQEDKISKAEKKLRGLQDEKLDLEKKIADNIKSQDDTIKDIDDQKKNLETLKGLRKKD